MTALVLLLFVAFVFWLYNSNKLKDVIATITGKKSSSVTTVQILPGPAGSPTLTIPGSSTSNTGYYQTDVNGSPLYATNYTSSPAGSLLNSVPVVDAAGVISFLSPELFA